MSDLEPSVVSDTSPSVINGYTCKFKDTVPEYCFCQRCRHVARDPHLTSCCGDHFCKDCISPYLKEKKPCPSCGEVDFNVFPNKRENKKILSLEVYCSMENRGCRWTGHLEKLEGHMEVVSGDCTYVDTQCPSRCGQRVQKRSVASHLVEECPLRDYTCKYCNFKASFKAVTQDHLPECPYYPIKCPNRCGVTFEREVLEDHMKMCCKEELVCSFSYAGCPGKFLREDEEKHMEEKSKEHLSLMAATTLKISVMLDKVAAENEESKKKLLKQEAELKKNREFNQEEELKRIKESQEAELMKEEVVEKERKLDQLKAEIEEKLLKQEAEMGKEVAAVKAKCLYLERALKGYEGDTAKNFAELQYNTGHSNIVPATFTVPYFNRLKLSNGVWYSTTLRTHFKGYTFLIAVRPNGGVEGHIGRGTHVAVYYNSMLGEYDDTLAWPSEREITVQLLNQHADENHVTKIFIIKRLTKDEKKNKAVLKFISHDELGWNGAKKTQYLKNDCLKFKILKC